MALNFCTTCYPLTLPDCPDSFDLETDLAAGTYYVWVEDRFAIKYVQEVTVGVSGSFTVDATGFPAGMFTANSATTSSPLARPKRRIRRRPLPLTHRITTAG